MTDAPRTPVSTPSPSGAGGVLPSLTGLRWCAALLVFGHHLTAVRYFDGSVQPLSQLLGGGGAAGVTLFFVLSGFVLTWGHRRGTASRTFWLHRFARVYPLHLAGIALALVAGALFVPVIVTEDPVALGANVLLVSAWNPRWWQAGNPVSWTLVCEAFFYAIFPLLIRALHGRRPRVLVGVAVLTVVATMVVPQLALWSSRTLSAYSSPVLRLPEFVLGIAVALLVRDARWRPPRVAIAVPVAVCGYLLLTSFDPLPRLPVDIRALAAPAFALLIAALTRRDTEGGRSFLARPLLVWLGQLSFAFYLVHLLVIASVATSWPDGHPRLPLLPAAGLALLAFAITMLLSVLLHHGIERPARRLILRLRRPSPPPAATRTAPASLVTGGSRVQ